MTNPQRPTPVLDIFAGPGGLGEGFAACISNPQSFRVALSIEKDPTAHETLRLRAFFRQFPPGAVPEQYYDYLRGAMELKELYDFLPEEAETADRQAWLAELGETPAEEVDALGAAYPCRPQPAVFLMRNVLRNALRPVPPQRR